MEIEEVVENIEPGGAKAEERKAGEGADKGSDREVVGQGEGQEEQKIFCPVMATKGVDPCSERRAEGRSRFKDRAFEGGYRGGLLGASFGADHIGTAGITPNFYIGGGVAHIFEAGPGEVLRQKCSFVCSFEIELAVAGVDFVEEAEIGGNVFGKLAIGSGDERNAATGGLFLLEKMKNLLPIGKTSGVEVDTGGELVF